MKKLLASVAGVSLALYIVNSENGSLHEDNLLFGEYRRKLDSVWEKIEVILGANKDS